MTSAFGSIKNKIVARDLLKERENCDFDRKELKSLFMDPVARKIFDKSLQDAKDDPKIAPTFKYLEYTPKEIQENWMRKLNYLWFHKDRKFYFQDGAQIQQTWFWQHQGQPMVGLHLNMFTMSIEQFCNEEQIKKWGPLTRNFDILGCYAQTEIGHGSNVGGLETTATFDKETDEFVLDMPTITATKWWPGDMGRYANFALVLARLIIEDDGDKNDYGPAPFIVQIRDRDTHKHLPGIKSGDMGPKMGYHGKDNGWLTLNKVRIPRDQLLQRFISVDREGSFSIEGNLKMLYSTMLKTRMSIICGSKFYQLAPLLMAVRYSIVRRQFKNISGQKKETQLLDYQTQQMKLFPILGKLFANIFSCEHALNQLHILLEGIEKDDFSKLDLMHHYTSGMKALFTQDQFDHNLQIRQSIGGAGYSAWSMLPRVIEDCSPYVTFEGDNTVMLQQSFNLIIKLLKMHKKGQDITKTDFVFAYLTKIDETLRKKCQARTVDDFIDIDAVDECLQVSLSMKISRVAKDMEESQASKKDQVNSLFALEIVSAAQDHMRYVGFQLFVAKLKSGQIKCKQNIANLTNICILYGLTLLYQDCKYCFESGYFQTGKESGMILDAIKKVNLILRPKVLQILESFDLPDHYLLSAIGNSYGDIYEKHLELAKDSRLNHTKAGDAIPDGYMEHIMPILKAKM